MPALTRLTWLLVIWTSVTSCHPLKEGSFLKDIYSADDSDKLRRHEATALEINWTTRPAGCSSILLSPTLVMTAHHCKLQAGAKLQSGWSVLSDGNPDLVVDSVLEDDPALDYTIAEIHWTSPMPSGQTFPPFVATDPSDIFTSQVKDQGDFIFTVGFPADKAKVWKGTYAEGQVKYLNGPKIYFNVGVINGNSGGGVLRKENNMLVAIALGGSKAYREAGWDQKSVDDSASWNFGTATWAIYPVSAVLKKQFPHGKNIYFGETFFPKTKVYLSLHSDGSNTNLKVAASHESESILLCPKAVYPCSKATSGAELLTLDLAASGRRFYSRQKPLSKNELEQLSLVAYDKAGQIIGQRRITLEAAK